MAPTRNPPNLFKLLEEVFSCDSQDKKGRIKAAIPTIQQNRRDIALEALKVEQENRRRGDKPGTFKTKKEARVLEKYRKMNNAQKRKSRHAQNLNPKNAPQSIPIFQALKVSEDVIKFVNEKIQGNQTPSCSPQTSRNVESFLSSIFCCSPRKK